MRWLKRDMWKAGIALAALLLLLVLVVWVPVSAAGAYGGASGSTTSRTATVQATPTVDATALNKEVLTLQIKQLQNQLQNQNNWLSNNSTALIAAFATIVVALFGIYQWTGNRKDERQKKSDAQDKELRDRAEERFKAAVTGLGDEKEGAKVSGAILLRSFLNKDDKDYERYYIQIFDLAVAHLRLPRTSPLPQEDPDALHEPPSQSDPNTPLRLTTLSQALITVLKESFPLARRSAGGSAKVEGSLQSLDATGIQLDNAYLAGKATDLQQMWMPEASLRGANLVEANLRQTNLRKANLRGAKLRRVDLSDADLRKADLSSADLRGATLSKTDLRGATLSKTDLSETDLSETDLRGADLRGANLSKADLSNMSLSGADLSEANLSKANLSETDLWLTVLTGANLSWTDLSRAKNLRAAVLSKSHLEFANLIKTDLHETNLSEVRLKHACLSEADLREATLRNADLSDADLTKVDLIRACLSNADLSGANLSKAHLTEADLGGASLVMANLSGASLVMANLSGANLREADLSRANLGGVDLSKVASLEDIKLYRPSRTLTKEQLEICKAQGAIIDEGNTTSSSQSTVSPSPPSQSNDVKAPSAPPAQVSTPTPDMGGSSATSSKLGPES